MKEKIKKSWKKVLPGLAALMTSCALLASPCFATEKDYEKEELSEKDGVKKSLENKFILSADINWNLYCVTAYGLEMGLGSGRGSCYSEVPKDGNGGGYFDGRGNGIAGPGTLSQSFGLHVGYFLTNQTLLNFMFSYDKATLDYNVRLNENYIHNQHNIKAIPLNFGIKYYLENPTESIFNPYMGLGLGLMFLENRTITTNNNSGARIETIESFIMPYPYLTFGISFKITDRLYISPELTANIESFRESTIGCPNMAGEVIGEQLIEFTDQSPMIKVGINFII